MPCHHKMKREDGATRCLLSCETALCVGEEGCIPYQNSINTKRIADALELFGSKLDLVADAYMLQFLEEHPEFASDDDEEEESEDEENDRELQHGADN